MTRARKAALAFIAPIDQAELACRLVEAAGKLKRPEGLTPMQCLAAMDEVDRVTWMRAAGAALAYVRECVEAGQVPQ